MKKINIPFTTPFSINIPIIILIIVVTLIISGCTTDEDIKRQQMLDNLATQMVQNQKMTAEQMIRLQNVEERMGILRGSMEDAGHTRQQVVEKRINELKDALSNLQTDQAEAQKKILLIETNATQQKRYLDKLLATLTQINSKIESSGSKRSRSTRSKKKGRSGQKQTPFQKALRDYRNAKYARAKSQFLDLINDKKIKGNQRARLIHNLGMSEYMLGNCDKAIVYYSKLFTQFPDAPFNPNGLLFLGKCFNKLDRQEEAKQSYDELIKRYPKAKQAKEATKLLKKL